MILTIETTSKSFYDLLKEQGKLEIFKSSNEGALERNIVFSNKSQNFIYFETLNNQAIAGESTPIPPFSSTETGEVSFNIREITELMFISENSSSDIIINTFII